MIPFPVTESTLSALHLSNFIQTQYGFSALAHCSLFRTGINHLYRVEDGNLNYVFRVYTFSWRSRQEISEEIRLLNHLKKNLINVSFALPDKDGNLIQEICAPEGIRYAVLFSFAEGVKSPRFTKEISYDIGVSMAKMHVCTHDYKLDRITYTTDTLLTHPLRVTKAFFKLPSDEIRFLEQVTTFLIEEYKKIKINEVRTGAVHLDIWFDNMHINSKNEITLFDFDFCGNGWLCYDIAYFLLQLFNTNVDQREYEEKADFFLKGYETVMPISAEEKRIIPLVSVSIWFFYLSVQCDKFDTWSNIFLNEDHLKRFMGTIKRWINYAQLPIETILASS